MKVWFINGIAKNNNLTCLQMKQLLLLQFMYDKLLNISLGKNVYLLFALNKLNYIKHYKFF